MAKKFIPWLTGLLEKDCSDQDSRGRYAAREHLPVWIHLFMGAFPGILGLCLSLLVLSRAVCGLDIRRMELVGGIARVRGNLFGLLN
jgi:hypothetical protein